MNRFLPTPLTAAALATALIATAAVATASLAAVAPPSQQETGRMSVNFADLDVATPSGARALVSRIRVAANELCGPDYVGDLGRMAERAACVRQVQDQAIRSVNRPMVTAAYYGLPRPDVVALAGGSR